MRTVLNAQTDAPSFPLVAPEILGGSPSSTAILGFHKEVWSWRRGTILWLTAGQKLAPLTPELAAFLRAALGDPGAYGPDFSIKAKYRYPSLPSDTKIGDWKRAHQYALAILMWRSMMIYFLSDVWDVIGPPLFDLPECNFAIEAVLMPEGPIRKTLCYNCLQPYGTDRASMQLHEENCIISKLRDREYKIPQWPE